MSTPNPSWWGSYFPRKPSVASGLHWQRPLSPVVGTEVMLCNLYPHGGLSGCWRAISLALCYFWIPGSLTPSLTLLESLWIINTPFLLKWVNMNIFGSSATSLIRGECTCDRQGRLPAVGSSQDQSGHKSELCSWTCHLPALVSGAPGCLRV